MKAESNAWDRNCNRITMASSQQQQQPCGRYVYWSDMETLALLSIIEGMGVVSQLDAKRQRNAHIFEAARVQMARRGFFRPIQQIRYRWKTLKSLYHKQKAAAAAGVKMTFRFMKGMQRLLEPGTVTGPSSPALPLPPLEGPPPTEPSHGSSATASPLAGGGSEEAGAVALQRHLHEDKRPQPQLLKEEEVCPAVKVELLVMEEDVEVGIEARQQQHQQQQEEHSGAPVCEEYAPGSFISSSDSHSLKEEAATQQAEFAVSVKVELAEEEVEARGGAHASAWDDFYSTTTSSSSQQQRRHHRSGRLLRREGTRVRGRDPAATPPPPPWEDGLHGGNGKRVRARSGRASPSLQQELVLLMREQVALMRQQLLLMRRLERRDERRRSWRTRRGLPPRAGSLCSTPGLPPGRSRGPPGPRGRHGPPDPRTPLAVETSRADAGGRGVRPAMEADRAARGPDEQTAAATGKLSV
ncbi:uncharacterized protein LOC133355945 isoform X2 [Lethenteron reissneri]|uniref:uncharacterized protein LOC133355943 isoform X2 n=1 Tax=Lethenteron reissneri TaxID=7753 RepID=UPI002AB7B166|nr:uncharacterized protein LOC133355943 isoform X2 [Lethenteron reissneri]XP_061429375.1 uncharacterized protein LOC133355945 isoform X2 [Lethenteron reissneri]